MARRHKGFMGLAQAGAGDVNPLWGAVTSGLVGTGTAMGVRVSTGLDKHAELIGLGAGVAAGLALMVSPKSRAAGFTGVVTALVTQGMRYAEAMFTDKQKIKDLAGAEATHKVKAGQPLKTQLAEKQAAASAGGFGAITAQNVQALYGAGGLGAITAERRQLAGAGGGGGSGLGIVSPEVIRSLGEQQPAMAGSLGQHQSQPPVNIVGGMQGLGSHYGATHFSH
jgi:hypothetical protein